MNPLTTPLANAASNAANSEIAIKDIHLPEAISWWPLAMGWWFLLALIILVTVGMVFWLKNSKQRLQKKSQMSLRKQVMSELVTIQKIEDDHLFVERLSGLLKRVAITQYGQKVAGLSGQQWLEFMDKHWELTSFSQGVGRVLIDLPYQKDPQPDRHLLLRICKNWLENQMSKDDR